MEQETNISELPELPGNLSPSALLVIVQGGVSYNATGQQVIDMVAGDMLSSDLPVITWDVTLGGTGSNPSVTYTRQQGALIRYAKNLGFLSVDVTWSARSAGGGNVQLSGPPGVAFNGVNILPSGFRNVTWGTNIDPVLLVQESGFINILLSQPNGSEALASVSALSTGGGRIWGSGIVRIN